MCVFYKGHLYADIIRRVKERGPKVKYICSYGRCGENTCLINKKIVKGCRTGLTSINKKVYLVLTCPNGREEYYEIPPKYIRTHGFWFLKTYEILADWIVRQPQYLYLVKENGVVTYKKSSTQPLPPHHTAPPVYHILPYPYPREPKSFTPIHSSPPKESAIPTAPTTSPTMKVQTTAVAPKMAEGSSKKFNYLPLILGGLLVIMLMKR